MRQFPPRAPFLFKLLENEELVFFQNEGIFIQLDELDKVVNFILLNSSNLTRLMKKLDW